MSKWIEYDGSGEIPNIDEEVFIRDTGGWESKTSALPRGWYWGVVTHYRIDDGTEAEEEQMTKKSDTKVTAKFLVVFDGNVHIEDSEKEAADKAHDIIQGGYDASEIKIYEVISERSVKIVIE